MSLITHLSKPSKKNPLSKTAAKKWMGVSLMLTMAVVAFSATGCSTTQEFKPTASVIVGAHKSL